MNYFQFTGALVLMLFAALPNGYAQNVSAPAQPSEKTKKLTPAVSTKKPARPAGISGQKASPKPAVKQIVTTGRIVGSVYFRGAKPEGKRINMSASLRSRCGVFKRVYPYHVNQASKMPQTLVYLSDPPAITWTQRHVKKVKMRRCDWQPALLGARQGDVLMLQNLDDASLHIAFQYEPQAGLQKQTEHSADLQRQRDMWIAQKNQRLAVKLNNPGSVRVHDDLTQAWSSARLRVFSHPFYALSDAKGEFVIANIPVGEYHLRAWNETLGEDEQIVEVRPGQTSFISLAYHAEGPIHPIQKPEPVAEKDEKNKLKQDFMDVKKNAVSPVQHAAVLKKNPAKPQVQTPLDNVHTSTPGKPGVSPTVQTSGLQSAKKATQSSPKSVKSVSDKKQQASASVLPAKVAASKKTASPASESAKKITPKVSAKTGADKPAASAKPASASGEN